MAAPSINYQQMFLITIPQDRETSQCKYICSYGVQYVARISLCVIMELSRGTHVYVELG